jgi:hypothetical protein
MATRRPAQLPATATPAGRAEPVLEQAGIVGLDPRTGRATVERVRQHALPASGSGPTDTPNSSI